jgi:hypothetical protein
VTSANSLKMKVKMAGKRLFRRPNIVLVLFHVKIPDARRGDASD